MSAYVVVMRNEVKIDLAKLEGGRLLIVVSVMALGPPSGVALCTSARPGPHCDAYEIAPPALRFGVLNCHKQVLCAGSSCGEFCDTDEVCKLAMCDVNLYDSQSNVIIDMIRKRMDVIRIII
jgi:hypothetical protein